MIPKIPARVLKNEELRIKNLELRVGRNKILRRIPNSSFHILNSQKDRLKKYVEMAQQYKKKKKQTLILVSGIIDVETLFIRLQGLADINVGKLHSQLSTGEYFKNWSGFQNGEIGILIGTRQAILSPSVNLGLIIINEEQDENFKQLDQTPRFHAVETARKLSEIMNTDLAIFSSAPSLELSHNFDIAKHQQRSDIKTHIVDAQNEFYGKNFFILSNKLQESIQKSLGKKQWSFLLINRRGDTSFVHCRDCGKVIKCENCGTPLVLHVKKNQELLMCHHCDFKISPPELCPACGSHQIKYSSPGTQGVEKELKTLFGQANIVRIDSDILKTKKGFNEVLNKVQKEAGIIVSTQVAVKAWLQEEFGLIGILRADSSLNRPDFRSSEKTFQNLQELKSRLVKNGEMIIQTFHPENNVFSMSAKDFYKKEISERKQLSYPPFSKIIKLSLSSRDMKKVLHESANMKKMLEENFKNITVLGPMDPAMPKRNLFTKELILKVIGWNEQKHLQLMDVVSDMWTVVVD
ncbi:primosomal protein N' [bacterium]|nr:MAG: primosomal protein N' [bacterium]